MTEAQQTELALQVVGPSALERAAVRITAPGVYDISEEQYHADPCPAPSLSASVAKLLLHESPAHARFAHPRLNPAHVEDDDPKFDAGKAVHRAFLVGENILSMVAADSWRTNAAKAARDQIRANGRIPVLTEQYDRLMAVLPILRRKVAELEDVPTPFSDGRSEQTLVWQEEGGIWCRARLDWLRDDRSAVDDLKTCASASPGGDFGQFGRAVWSMGHDIQAAFYRRGVRKLFEKDPVFRFIAFELDGAHGISVTSLGPEGDALADLKVSRAIGLWAHCLKTNTWPGYPRFRVQLDPPKWMVSQYEAALEDECL